MLTVSVLDSNAEERLRTLQWLQQAFEVNIEGIEYLPRVSFRPLSISELKFQAAPDILVIGPALASGPANDIIHIKKQVPGLPILIIANESQLSISQIEYLARIGVDDVVSQSIAAEELVRRFVMLSSKVRQKEGGKLFVIEAAKGGVGATSLTAACGELLAESGKKTLLLDLDSERQSLSRFLGARPFINDSLQSIIEGHRPLSRDFVEQATVQVWQDLPDLFCMPPSVENSLIGTLCAQTSRVLITLLEELDSIFDVVLIDASRATGTLRRILHRSADKVIFVTESDPASVYASFEKIKRIKQDLSPDATFRILENQRRPGRAVGLRRGELIDEYRRVAGIEASQWIKQIIPYCSDSERWPGSGLTPFSAGGRKFRTALRKLQGEFFESDMIAKDCQSWAERCSILSSMVVQLITGGPMRKASLEASNESVSLTKGDHRRLLAQPTRARKQLPWQASIADEMNAVVTPLQ